MKFYEMLTKMNQEQITQVKEMDIDYDLWNQALQDFPQGLYDMLILDALELSEEEKSERKATLDAAYVYIQSKFEEVSKELKVYYSDIKTNRLNY